MATPLIEVIESCEQDIETFRADLEVIIAEADEDGVRDDEEAAEIKNFEDSIAELTLFTEEKRAEFETNKAEWDSLSSNLADLLGDFQTLTDWGDPNLQLLDQRITEMDRNADSLFFRDAISSFEAAQTIIDPLMEEYNKQSAAKLTFDEELASAEQRVAQFRQSDSLNQDITARIDQLETDLVSCEVLTENLDYVTALSTLPGTVEEISRVETMIAELGETKDRVQAAFGALIVKRQDALNELVPHQGLMDEFLEDFLQGERTYEALMNDSYFAQAELLITQMEQSISATLARIPALVAAQEKQEADEALLEKERDQLASDLSASAPQGTLWKLYEWKDGDSFEKLASDSEVKDASVLLGYPNNKKLSDYYQSNNELPAGTLVCVVDPAVKIFKMNVEGEDIFITEDALSGYVAEHSKLMQTLATNLNTLFLNLEKNNTSAYEARHMFGWVTQYMSGWDANEPAAEREKARASIKSLQGDFSADKADQFATLVLTAAADCQAYKAALQSWLAEMQTELKATMESLAFYEHIATTCAIVAAVTIAAPASVPMAALYAGCAAAGISVFSDSTKAVGAALTGSESPVSISDVATNAITAGLKTGISAAIFGGIFSKLGPALASRISSISIVEAQSTRLLANSFWSGHIVEMVKVTEAGAKFIENSGGTLHISKLAPYVAPVVVESFLKLFGRIAWGERGAISSFLNDTVTGFIDNNPEVLNTPSEDVTSTTIANEILDDAKINGIFDIILQENEAAFEQILTEELKGIDLDGLE